MKKMNYKILGFMLSMAMLLFSSQIIAQTFTGGGNPQSIPVTGTGGFPCVGGPTTSAANVGLAGTVGTDFVIDNVTIDLTHTFDSDLEIDLISPSGTVWDLSSDNGGAGDNFTNTVFIDGAPSITTGAAPFTGSFEAEQGPLNTGFAGEAVNGNWTLSICDDAGGDTGTLLSFSITFSPIANPCAINIPATITVSNDAGVCGATVTVLATDSGTCADPITNDFNGGGADATGLYPVGTTTVTFTSGNTTASVDVIVSDDEAATLSCPGDLFFSLDPGACDQIVGYSVSATDNCPLVGDAVSFTLNNDISAASISNSVGCPGGGYQTLVVHDLPALGVTSDIELSGVDFGIFQIFGTVNLTANIYSIAAAPAGAFNYADLTLIASGTQSFGAQGAGIGTIPLAGTIPVGTVVVIELIAPNGTFTNGFVPGYNAAGVTNGGDTWLASNFCGVPNPTPLSNVLAGFTDQFVVSLNANLPAEPIQIAGLPSGSTFPIGTTTNTFTITDGAGNVSTCSFDVIVAEFVPTSNDITCNGLVNISLDENCQAVIGADQILEGNNYGCYDNFSVTFASGPQAGQPLVLGPGNVGQTIDVMVTNPSGNPCWGSILVEDKLIPELVCEDLTIGCADDATPGSSFPVAASQAVPTITVPLVAGTTSGTTNIAQGGTISDVNVDIATDHTWVGDLVITVTSPAGTSVELLNNLGGPGLGCNNLAGQNMNVTMDDEATDSYMVMDGQCPPVGTFQPLNALSAFDGEDLSGTWTVDVEDLAGGDGGDVDVVLNITAQGGASFPLPAGATAIPAGPNTFTVLGFDPCGAATLTFTETSGGDLCGGTQQIIRNWTITDGSNNSSSCTQTITVTPATIADVTADLPGDITLECGATLPAPITSLPGSCDNIAVTLNGAPTIIDICDGSFKMLRTYIVVDWCTNETLEHTQIISVLDTQGPALTCGADLVVGTTSNSCSANVALANPTYTDCGGGVTFEIAASAGDLNGNILTNLPLGTHTVTYTATDACGNTSECTQNIEVIDNIAPIAICDEHTIVSIGTDGTATINAITFDDGSLDNCGIESMQVRRMDNSSCPGFDGTSFGDNVPFFCCDIGNTVMVELRVTDAAGNSNSCMVEVDVQDKLAPTIICPANKTIDCDEDALDLVLTGEAIASDNCAGVTVTFNDISNTVNDCFEGTITRVWTATDGVGLTSSCIQTITVTNQNTFDGNITFPLDYEATTCGLGLQPSDLPAANAYPQFTEGDCNNIAMTFEDTQLGFGAGDACLKILRKWIIIDWCQVPNGADPTDPATPGVWHHTQVIKVVNSNDPGITAVSLPAVIDNLDSGCGSAFAAFAITADDDCTAQSDLDVTWEFNTGLTGSGFSASGAFANGSYSLTYTVSDQCGNSSTLTHNFTVVDAKKPTPVCIFGIASTVMPSSGSVLIWASDFESGSSYDNCTAYEDLQFSFSPDVNDKSLTIECADISADGLVSVDLYVTDASGNFDFCSTFINVQDPNGVCGGPAAFISGTVETEDQDAVEDVIVSLTDNSGPMTSPVVTGTNGQYVFTGMTYGDYDVTPEKDVNYLNGVTTFDLVLISQHILGTNLFDTPYKWIAADANKSNSITTLDIVKLRALILHIDTELSNNDSWRFVDMDYAFVNPNNPLAESFPESIDLDANALLAANFIGVKVGDVNGSAQPNQLLGTDTRTFNGKLALQLETTKVAQGETFTVDFRAKDFNNIAGYQFTLGFENVEFVDVTSNLPSLGTENFGLTKLSEGLITTSWNTASAVSLEDNDVLFTMTFLANTAINTSDVFAINSRYTESEAYNGSDLFDVVLEFNGNEVANGFELFQNTPNPFKAETTIGFNLPEAGEVTLKIYDVSGRVLSLMEIEGAKGFNSVNVNRGGIEATGVLYYQLETATETATKKMIIVD